MELYDVQYKLKNQFFFRTVKNVEGDTISAAPNAAPVRVLFLPDKSAIEIPIDGTVFKLGKERFYSIKDKASQEAGQPILTK